MLLSSPRLIPVPSVEPVSRHEFRLTTDKGSGTRSGCEGSFLSGESPGLFLRRKPVRPLLSRSPSSSSALLLPWMMPVVEAMLEGVAKGEGSPPVDSSGENCQGWQQSLQSGRRASCFQSLHPRPVLVENQLEGFCQNSGGNCIELKCRSPRMRDDVST